MAFYVPPDGEVRVLKGVPVDLKVDHTLWFDSLTNQFNYFSSKISQIFQKVSYVRKSRGYIKVPASADSLFDCNYLMYRNTGFSNKWFYAFITSVEYISNQVTGIRFEIDNLQTWFFEMQLAECYVEREHSTSDHIGDNKIPEGLETGEYIYTRDYSELFTKYDICFYTTFYAVNSGGTWSFTDANGAEYTEGLLSGLHRIVFSDISQSFTQSAINSFINAVVNAGKVNGIVSCSMIPYNSDSMSPEHGGAGTIVTTPKITALDGYGPKNFKLLTYPYCFVEVRNEEGAVGIFPQEYFSNNTPQFAMRCSPSVATVLALIPMNYKSNGIQYNYPEAMYINNMVQVSFNTDLYKAYMAQSLTAKIGQNAIDALNNGAKAIANFSLGEAVDNLTNKMLDGLFKFGFEPVETLKEVANGIVNKVNNIRVPNITNFADTTEALVNSTPAQNIAGIAAALTSKGNVISQIYSDMSTLYAKSVQAPHNTGSNTPDFLTAFRQKGFRIMHKTITKEYAKKIDDYFSRYGYATKAMKVPNIHARKYWSYVKTIGCQIHGNLPTEAITAIQNIFDHGVTFWAVPSQFGNYNLTNDIVS